MRHHLLSYYGNFVEIIPTLSNFLFLGRSAGSKSTIRTDSIEIDVSAALHSSSNKYDVRNVNADMIAQQSSRSSRK